jgi:hypothetical protein
VFLYYWRELVGPASKLLGKTSMTVLTVFTLWPLPLAFFVLWASYQILYGSFYGLEITRDRALVLKYPWPKGNVRVERHEIELMEVHRAGFGWEADDILVIQRKDGLRFRSDSPVPGGRGLVRKLRMELDGA